MPCFARNDDTVEFRMKCKWPLSGIQSITMVKSAQPGEGGGGSPDKSTDIFPLFLTCPYMYSVRITHQRRPFFKKILRICCPFVQFFFSSIRILYSMLITHQRRPFFKKILRIFCPFVQFFFSYIPICTLCL
jgi:hypothetical protein